MVVEITNQAKDTIYYSEFVFYGKKSNSFQVFNSLGYNDTIHIAFSGMGPNDFKSLCAQYCGSGMDNFYISTGDCKEWGCN